VKITRLEILKVPPSWVWLKIHTDEGLTGLGEPYLENHPESVIAEVRRLEPLLVGRDPRQIEAPHCPLSPLAFAASVQLDTCSPDFLVQEHNEVNDWREGGRTYIGKGYFAEPFVLDDEGCVAVPSRPGLGVELDEAGMAAIMARPWRAERG